MASAFKCDRCCAFSEDKPKQRVELEEGIFKNRVNVRSPIHNLDLCEDCASQLQLFLENSNTKVIKV